MYDRDTSFLFVYGTLKRGLANHRYMESATYVATGFVVGTMWWLSPGIPIIRVPSPAILVRGNPADPSGDPQRLNETEQRPPNNHNTPMVEGEIYSLTREQFIRIIPRLDELEEHNTVEPSVYHRVAVMAMAHESVEMEPMPVWTYVDASPRVLRKPIMKGVFP